MYRRFTVLAFALHLLPALPAQVAVEPPTKLAEVVVTPSRFGVAEAATMPAASLTAAELEVLPQLGDDLFRSITRLPGLAADDISAQFWVRGAPQSELLARLDGVELLEPFHLKDVGGALSIVDPTVIRRLDLTTGGFSAEYGDRLAGVLTMDTQSDPHPLTAFKLSLTGIGGGTRGVFSGARTVIPRAGRGLSHANSISGFSARSGNGGRSAGQCRMQGLTNESLKPRLCRGPGMQKMKRRLA